MNISCIDTNEQGEAEAS